MEADPARMCAKLVGLGDVDLVGIDDRGEDEPLAVISSCKTRPTCGGCGSRVRFKGHRTVVLVDLPAFGRPVDCGGGNGAGCARTPTARLGRSSARSHDCPGAGVVDLPSGPVGDHRGRGKLGRSVDEFAAELGCDWHTVNNEVGSWGEALLEADTSRVGHVEAVGVDQDVVLAEGPLAHQGVVQLCGLRAAASSYPSWMAGQQKAPPYGSGHSQRSGEVVSAGRC